MKPKYLITVIVILFTFFSCSEKVKTKIVTLKNGKQIKLQHIKAWVVGDGTKILILTYITDISVDNLYSLQQEVDQIWPWYRGIVDEKRFKNASIRAANIVREGFISWQTQNYSFLYQKKNGIWIQYKKQPKNNGTQPGTSL